MEQQGTKDEVQEQEKSQSPDPNQKTQRDESLKTNKRTDEPAGEDIELEKKLHQAQTERD